jgi:hypothetical protein
MSRFSWVPSILVWLVSATAPLTAQDQGGTSSGPGEKDWLEFYYENPTPERLVDQMKEWAVDGTLDNDHAKPALIAFLSQVIRQNEDQLSDWYATLSGLEPGQMQVFRTAMLYSRTEEADKILTERYGKDFEAQRRETAKILEMPLDERRTMDMLWGFFYATGSEGAIRRIVTAFRFLEATAKPPGVDVPEGYVPLYKELPRFAFGSLVANGQRHPKVVEILKKMLESDQTLLGMEKDGVYDVLSELDPKAYPVKETPANQTPPKDTPETETPEKSAEKD